MQRHFSNRGEALAEVTAARMLARRIRPAEPASATQRGRQAKAAQWFTSQRTRPKAAKHPKHDADITPLL